MTIAFITMFDSQDVKAWSGLGYFIPCILEKKGYKVIKINASIQLPIYLKVINKLQLIFFRKGLTFDRYPAYLKLISKNALRLLSNKDYDVILSPGTLPLYQLKTDKPVFFWTDATFNSLVDFYPDMSHLSSFIIKNGNKIESTILKNVTGCIYSSQWAANDAVIFYKANPKKVSVVPFGANIVSAPKGDVTNWITRRVNSPLPLKFLWIGVDWIRKGGNKALELVRVLNENGILSELTTVGCELPENILPYRWHTHYLFLNKSMDDDVQILSNCYLNAHFFVLPTVADCVPVVFAEAAFYGLPILSTDVGGCGTSVIDNYNGLLINKEMFVDTAFNFVKNNLPGSLSYFNMSLNSSRLYNEKLNWDAAISSLLNILNPAIK